MTPTRTDTPAELHSHQGCAGKRQCLLSGAGEALSPNRVKVNVLKGYCYFFPCGGLRFSSHIDEAPCSAPPSFCTKSLLECRTEGIGPPALVSIAQDCTRLKSPITGIEKNLFSHAKTWYWRLLWPEGEGSAGIREGPVSICGVLQTAQGGSRVLTWLTNVPGGPGCS